MYLSMVYLIGAVTLCLLGLSEAKAVFAHYMVGTITEDHAHQDIDDAIAVGLDGFALNIGDVTQPYVATTLSYLFGYAASKDFKLFISMDVAASGTACAAGRACCSGPDDFESLLAQYVGNPAYYLGPNGAPMISTFSSGGKPIDVWTAWKQHFANDMYFMPMFDETNGYYEAAKGWWSYWGDIIDGLFSWEAAWPLVGDTDPSAIGDVSSDVPVMEAAYSNKKGYMIALSPLQYKDSYSANIYRPGDLNMPVRMRNILSMSPQPDLIEIITWNDGPESHYIGNIWPELDTDTQSTIYATQTVYPHTAWQPLVNSFVQAWKAGGSTSSMAPPANTPVGAIWYKTILQSAPCPANVAQPQGFNTGTDSLNWAVVIAPGSSGMQVRAISNGVTLQTTDVSPGLNWGSPTGMQAGVQILEVLDKSGNIVMSASGGKCVSAGCPDGIYNMNYQVVGLASGASNGGRCS